MLVPLKLLYPLGTVESTLEPGAVMSGFIKFEPSAVTGPKELKELIEPLDVSEPTANELLNIAGGVRTVLHEFPLLEAALTTTTPELRKLLIAVSKALNVAVLHPSTVGQCHELLIT